MTRIVTTAAVIVLLTVLVGCEANTGTSQRLPGRSITDSAQPLAVATSENEIDLVEKMAANRQAYQRSLQALIQYYSASGNYGKTSWAQEELTALNRIPQYQYIIEAQVMPATLTATESIAAADQLYAEAEELERKAGVIPVAALKDEEVLRAALRKYGQLIIVLPTARTVIVQTAVYGKSLSFSGELLDIVREIAAPAGK